MQGDSGEYGMAAGKLIGVRSLGGFGKLDKS